MGDLCVMASPMFSCEQRLSRVQKENRALVAYQGKIQETKNAFLHFQVQNLKEQRQSIQILPDSEPVLSPITPVLFDMQDSLQIAEQCAKHEKILKHLLSGSNLTTQVPNSLFFPNLVNPGNQIPDFANPENEIPLPSSLLNFVGNMSEDSLLSIDLNGRILFSGSGSEMKDLISILSEFNLYNKLPAGTKASLLVPYFQRSRFNRRGGKNVSVLKFPIDTLAPLKSPEKIRTKGSAKKKQNKGIIKGRDIFQTNNFHAFESFLSILLDNKRNSTSTDSILLLKKSGPKIANILTQFSIGIAGTGLAVLLSVAFKTRVPLCAARILNTSFGFGLFWLSSAINGLRDTIMQMFKISNKIKVKDDEIAFKIESKMRDVVFRAGALVALAFLRFV